MRTIIVGSGRCGTHYLADVLTAACGQLAGAHYGAAAIPAAWRNSLIGKEIVSDFADRLLARALEGLAG